jgi:predicted amidophosphoribosyltransferase
LRTDILLKPNPNKQQATLSKKQRIHNLNECFQINPKVRDLPRRVALFDDVVTTGATIEAAANLLKKKGVEYVAVWSLARTAKPKNK